jgi:hypothetical protein
LYEISRHKILNSYNEHTTFIQLYELNSLYRDNSYNFIISSAWYNTVKLFIHSLWWCELSCLKCVQDYIIEIKWKNWVFLVLLTYTNTQTFSRNYGNTLGMHTHKFASELLKVISILSSHVNTFLSSGMFTSKCLKKTVW